MNKKHKQKCHCSEMLVHIVCSFVEHSLCIPVTSDIKWVCHQAHSSQGKAIKFSLSVYTICASKY